MSFFLIHYDTVIIIRWRVDQIRREASRQAHERMMQQDKVFLHDDRRELNHSSLVSGSHGNIMYKIISIAFRSRKQQKDACKEVNMKS